MKNSALKIVFVPQGCVPFHARTTEIRPLGGIESATIYLAAALQERGHEVFVFSSLENPPLSVPLYLPYRAIGDLPPIDVLIAVRDWQGTLLPVPCRKRFFWTGDSYDQPQTFGLGDKRVLKNVDAFLAVSEWHRESLSRRANIPEEKTAVLRNGIRLDYFAGHEERSRKRLIYSSTPYRGLHFMPEIFELLLQTHPEAEFHIFSGFDVYAGTQPPPERALREFANLKSRLQAIPQCHFHGNVRQRELAREFMKSAVLVYPNTFEETSCITAMEAQAGGCAIISSARGALPETVAEAGILIEGEAGSESYTRSFLEALNGVLSDDERFLSFSEKAKQQALRYDWGVIAAEFEEKLLNHSHVV